MSLYYTLDAEGQPVPAPDVLTWAQWFETADRIVGRTEVAGQYVVSTVFLGLDHSFGDVEPVLWESMTFPAGSYAELTQRRYSSLADAKAGHAEMVAEAEGRVAAEALTDIPADWKVER